MSAFRVSVPAGLWIQIGADIDGEAAFDRSGVRSSLSSDGQRLAVGAGYNDGNGPNAGHARVFEWNTGTGAWVQLGQDIDGRPRGTSPASRCP